MTPTAEDIYAAYPRKVKRPRALKAINLALAGGIPPDQLLSIVTAYAASVIGKEKQFIPHPATWFNDRQYEDPIEAPGARVFDREHDSKQAIRTHAAIAEINARAERGVEKGELPEQKIDDPKIAAAWDRLRERSKKL